MTHQDEAAEAFEAAINLLEGAVCDTGIASELIESRQQNKKFTERINKQYSERMTAVQTIRKALSQQGWQPIETAPRDGTEIWCYTTEGEERICWWEEKEPDGLQSMGCDAGWHSKCVGTFPGRSFGNPKYFSEPEDQPTNWKHKSAPPRSDREGEA